MVIGSHMTKFADRQVIEWEIDTPLTDPSQIVYRISANWGSKDEENWHGKFASFIAMHGASDIQALIVGAWTTDSLSESSDAAEAIKALADARTQLPHLKFLFFGDITYEQSEISWIAQNNISPLLIAYPELSHLQIRGSNELALGQVHHEHLKALIIETGGLDVNIVHDIQNSHFPALEHLELWLGTDNYGATTTVEDLAPLFAGTLFPNLQYLGLRDSDIADEIALAITSSPLLDRIQVLDLSMGTLGDVGATALLNCPAIRKLQKLDIHHHYCSPAVIDQLKTLGIEVDIDSAESEDEGFRYVEVGE